tara:strand:- start:10719 stop:11270 length:552 start_codon:yes stop_codon:yes gene_type:complete
MKTFREFTTEVYDPEVQGRSQIRKMGQGGRIGQERKKTAPEKRRMKAAGGGKMVPAKDYKDRKDIGKGRARSEREQQPTQTRGSAALTPREQQKKARAERMASKSGKKTPRELAKAAQKLLQKKKEKKVDPKYKPAKASGLTRAERQQINRAGKRLVKDMRSGKEKPRSAYEPGMSVAMRGKE